MQRRMKQLTSPKRDIKRFERQLQIQRDHLRETHNGSELQKRRDMKLKAFFLSEKFNREKQIAQELERNRKLAERKREQERIATEERWLRGQQSKVLDKKTREIESHKIVLRSILAAQENVAKSAAPATGPSRFQHKRTGSEGRPGLGFGDEYLVPVADVPPVTGRASLAVPRQRKLSNFAPGERKSIGYLGEFDGLDPFTDPIPHPIPDANFVHHRQTSGRSDTTVGGRKPPSNGSHREPDFQHPRGIQPQRKPRRNQHQAPVESLILRSKKNNARGNRHSMYEYDSHSQSDQATSTSSLKAESTASLSIPEPQPESLRLRHHSADAQALLRQAPTKPEVSAIYDRLGVDWLNDEKLKRRQHGSIDSELDRQRPPAASLPPNVNAPRLPFRSNSSDSVVSVGIGSSELPRRQFQKGGLDLAQQPPPYQHQRGTVQGQKMAAIQRSQVPPSPPPRPRVSTFHHSYTQFQPQTRGKPQSRPPPPPPQQAQGNQRRTEDQFHAHGTRPDIADNRLPPSSSHPSKSAVPDNRHEQAPFNSDTQAVHWTNPMTGVNAARPTKTAPHPHSGIQNQTKPPHHHHHPGGAPDQPLTSYPRSYTASMANSLRGAPPQHGRGHPPPPSGRVTHYPSPPVARPPRPRGPIVGSLV